MNTKVRHRTVHIIYWIAYTILYIHLNFKYHLTHSFDDFVMFYAFSSPIIYAIYLVIFGSGEQN